MLVKPAAKGSAVYKQCPQMITPFGSIALPDGSAIEGCSIQCRAAQSHPRVGPRRELRRIAKAPPLRPKRTCQTQHRNRKRAQNPTAASEVTMARKILAYALGALSAVLW